MPGMIDDQVHFREPGFEHKGTIATESSAAIAGGVTSYMEMPNCNPLTISEAALRDKHARAARVSLANYAFYLGATNDNLEAIKSVDHALACGDQGVHGRLDRQHAGRQSARRSTASSRVHRC